MRSRGPCNAGKVPPQQSVVLHNVSTAAGDDASHHHARDETPTLRNAPRGTAGIDNADAHSHVQIHIAAAHAYTHAHKNTHGRAQINAFESLCFNTRRHQKHTHIHRVST